MMQSPEHEQPAQQSNSNATYSLRVRKNVVIDRDYSPSPPGQPSRKKPRIQTSPKKEAKLKKVVTLKSTHQPTIEDPTFALLKAGKSANAIVEKWMKDYEESPDQAMVQCLQLIVASCGCSGKLDANMIHNMEMKDIITRLSEYFEEDSGDYPIMMNSPQWKKFRLNFGDFLTLFIIRCKANIIYDVTLMDSLIQLLTGLSESFIRAFRHTATFAAMKISSSIVDVVVELVGMKEKNATQIETEKAKLAQSGSSERLELLLQQKTELDSKLDELTAMIQYMFRSIFVHRYRDVVCDIRSICITEMGNWVRVYPAHFLDDSYLKYIGWSLCDKTQEVRLRCVAALLPLYEDPVLVGRMELFTSKFKDRLASMVMDVDAEVASKACQMITHIYRAFPALLSINDCVPLYEMVYCNNRQLAVAAATFVSAKLFSPDADGMQADNFQLLKDLVSFYKEGQVHNHPAYLVDSFIDICPMLKDWPAMIGILLSNDFYDNDSHLIAMMSTAVRQAATGEHPPNRIVISIRRGPGAGTEKKDLRLLHEERVRISEAFIPALPKLIAKFIADQENVSHLLDIFLHLELEIYSAGRHEQPLNELMQLIERIVEQYSSEEIVKQVAAIFQFISTDMAVAQFTETSRIRLVDGVAHQLRHQLEQLTRQNGGRQEELDQEDEIALLSNYRKLTAFTAAIDVPAKWDYWDQTMDLLIGERFQSGDLVDKAVLLCFQTLTWNIKRLVATQDWKEESVEAVRRRRDQFLRLARQIIRNMASGVENAFLCLCDTLIMFNWKLVDGFGQDHPIQSLAVKLDRETIISITTFVTDNVFVGEEEEGAEDERFPNLEEEHMKVQLLGKRRNILAHYLKLFVYGLLPIIDMSGLLRYFTKFFTDFGDIFRHLLQECRKLDKVATAKAIVKALIHSYDEIKFISENGIVDQDSEQFQSLRELAKKLSLSFGVDNIKNREPIAVIHHEGIKYALQLQSAGQVQQQRLENFQFFEILQEFSPKLHRQDKLAVLRYLDKNCSQDKQIDNEDIWQTYQLYRSSLAKAE